MTNREKVLKGLECCALMRRDACQKCPYENECRDPYVPPHGAAHLAADALELLKEQESLKQKMWNALYAEEDKLEKQYVGTDDHDGWFFVFRPWLQRGFEIALKVVVAENEEQ